MELVVLFGFIVGIVLFIFSSAFSAIPFFPTSSRDLEEIIKKMKLKDDQVILDLGAGTGTVIFAAASEAHKKGLKTQFVAIDINFLLVVYMLLRVQFHPHKKYIKIMQGDLFKMHYADLVKPYKDVVFYMYVSPWFTNALAQLIIDTDHPSRILSYYYPVTILKQKDKVSGVHDIYEYEVK